MPIDDKTQADLSVSAWQVRLGQWAKEKGWGRNRRSVLEKIALAHTELSEATEEIRNGRSPTEIYLMDDKPCGFPVELADAVMRLILLAEEEGIDLSEAMILKFQYNSSRPPRHGGKVA